MSFTNGVCSPVNGSISTSDLERSEETVTANFARRWSYMRLYGALRPSATTSQALAPPPFVMSLILPPQNSVMRIRPSEREQRLAGPSSPHAKGLASSMSPPFVASFTLPVVRSTTKSLPSAVHSICVGACRFQAKSRTYTRRVWQPTLTSCISLSTSITPFRITSKVPNER